MTTEKNKPVYFEDDPTAALKARLNCTKCGAEQSVRLTLGTVAPGDVPIWRCFECEAMWDEQGQPTTVVYIDPEPECIHDH